MVIGLALLALVVLVAVLALFRRSVKPTHAGGIVYKQVKGRMLFLITTSASNRNKWVLPKGRIEKHEMPGFAAIREVMEETGVQARVIKKASTVKYRRKSGNRVVAVYYIMEFEKQYDTSTENRQVLWVEKREAMEKLQREEVKRMLEEIQEMQLI